MRPTHYHVPLHQSILSKVEIQQLVFALSHNYFNWSGPIKVPAPCMYAHKIADLFTRIGYSKKSKGLKQFSQSDTPDVKKHVDKQKPLSHKLFFL